MDIEKIISFLKEEIALMINQPIDSIESDQNFLKLGISSIETLKFINKLQKKLEIQINPIAMLEYKTILKFSEYLHECIHQVEEV